MLLVSFVGVLGATPAAAAAGQRTVVAWGAAGAMTRPPAGLSGAVAVAAGSDHSLALTADGTVVAFGTDYYGQTVVPDGLSGVTAIAAGGLHSSALRSDGTVVCWGYDGDGANSPPSGLSDVTAISDGGYHVLARRSDGTVASWGSDAFGATETPGGLSGVVAVAAGNHHSLALRSDGTVVGWGYDRYGQADVPAGLSDVVAIAAGVNHSLALKGDGTVVAWGSDAYGQTEVPAALAGVTAIAAGGYDGLALTGDGAVVGWGRNPSGETTQPATLTDVTAIAAGLNHSVALGHLTQTVAFTSDPPAPGVVGDSYTPTATGGGSGAPVVLGLGEASTGCSMADGVVSFTGAGTCLVDADQAGSGTYAAAPTVTQTIAVRQPGTVAFTSPLPTPGVVGRTYTPTTSGAGSSAPVVLSLDEASTGCALSDGEVSFTAPGTCVVHADQAGDDTYTAAPPATQTISVDSAPVFTSPSPATTAAVGKAYTAGFTASGSPAPTYRLVNGPPFLAIDGSTGEVTGTPTAPGSFRYAVTATNPAGSVTTRTIVTVAAAAWQPSVRGFTRPEVGSVKGYTLGVVGNSWTVGVTQPGAARTAYAGSITLDHGTFSRVAGVKLDPGDTYRVDGGTLTFSFTHYGDLDGLTFTTPDVASAVTFRLGIAGRPATAGQVFTGQDHAASPTGSPLTYRRTSGG